MVQGEQRNKWQGPAAGGKDAVYAGCEFELTQWSATGLGVSARVFLGSLSFLFVLLAGATVQFSGFHNVYCPNASCLVLGLSFYPLEQAPNLVFYAMSKLRDSNERFNLNRGILNPKPGEKRAPLLPKNSSADWRLEIGLGLVSSLSL